MNAELARQLPAMALLLCGGTAAGLLYDLFGLIRVLLWRKRFFCAAADVAYVLVCAAMFLHLVLIANAGQLRWHTFVCAGAGTVLYAVGAGRFVRAFFAKTVGYVQRRANHRRGKNTAKNANGTFQ